MSEFRAGDDALLPVRVDATGNGDAYVWLPDGMGANVPTAVLVAANDQDARIAELEAKVARVEALADEWDQGGTIWQMFAANLRDALKGNSND